MRFVAHRHCQHTLDRYFSGDYPGSGARIPHECSLLMIMLQTLFPFLPGTFVEVMGVTEKTNVALRGKSVDADFRAMDGGGEMDPDLMDAMDAIAKAAALAEAEKESLLENTCGDIGRDLTSMRWLNFYSGACPSSPSSAPCHCTPNARPMRAQCPINS